MIICVVDTTPTTANANPIFDGKGDVDARHKPGMTKACQPVPPTY
jgi:hypothetical protein